MTNIRNLLVSLCIPLYNGEKYLRQCIESAVAQTHANVEILFVDDHSQDSSASIVEEYACKDPRIRLFRNKRNLGLVENWNRSVLLARGEWIKFLFQDDFLDPDCIKMMLEASTDQALMVACGRDIISEQCDQTTAEYFIGYRSRFNIRKILGDDNDIFPLAFCGAVLDNFLENFLGEPTCVMLKKDAFAKFGMFNANLIQLCDFEYWLRVGTNAGLIYVPNTLAFFRVHGGSATTLNEKQSEFRKNHIDQLICYYELASSPFYEHLRSIASSRGQKIDFAEVARIKLKNILSMLDEQDEGNGLKAKELKIVMDRYPMIKDLQTSGSLLRKLVKACGRFS